jgi:hypothetical protein
MIRSCKFVLVKLTLDDPWSMIDDTNAEIMLLLDS